MSLLPVAAASTSAQTSTMQLQRAGTMYAAGNFVQALRRARLEPLSQSLSQPAKMSHRHHLVTWIIQNATVRAEISYCCSLRNYPRQLQGAHNCSTHICSVTNNCFHGPETCNVCSPLELDANDVQCSLLHPARIELATFSVLG